MRAADVAGPEARREPVTRAVRRSHHLLLGGERKQGEHRPEDLVLRQVRIRPGVGEDGRLGSRRPRARAVGGPPAGADLAALGAGPSRSRNTSRLGLSWRGGPAGSRAPAVAEADGSRRGPSPFEPPRRRPPVGERAGAGDAGLARGGEHPGDDARLGVARVASSKTMLGDLPPSSRVTGGALRGRLCKSARPGLTPPVSDTLSTRWVLHQRRAGLVAVAGDDVEDAGRKAEDSAQTAGQREDRRRGQCSEASPTTVLPAATPARARSS